MISASPFSVDFDLKQSSEIEKTDKIDFLPCKIPKDVQECNRDIYFDPCITQDEDHPALKTVVLQGRKIVGREHDLKSYGNYEGRVLGLYSDEMESGSLQRNIRFQTISKFDKVTEWQKDKWNQGEDLTDEKRKFVGDMMEYLECAQILHGDDE